MNHLSEKNITKTQILSRCSCHSCLWQPPLPSCYVCSLKPPLHGFKEKGDKLHKELKKPGTKQEPPLMPFFLHRHREAIKQKIVKMVRHWHYTTGTAVVVRLTIRLQLLTPLPNKCQKLNVDKDVDKEYWQKKIIQQFTAIMLSNVCPKKAWLSWTSSNSLFGFLSS